MTSRFEDLWNSADDGASTPLATFDTNTQADLDGLIAAWSIERHERLEFELLLDESRKFIERLVDRDEVPAHRRRQGERLIRAIRRIIRTTGVA